MITIAVWKVKDLLNAGKTNKGVIRGMQPLCEQVVGRELQVHALYFDHGHSDNHVLNIVLALNRGVRFFTIRTQERIIEESTSQFDNQNDQLGNIY